MQVPRSQIKATQRIGTLEGSPVYHIDLIGGLQMVVVAKNGGTETLGVGPNQAVAVVVAEREHPSLQLSALQKSERPFLSETTVRLAKALTRRFRLTKMQTASSARAAR